MYLSVGNIREILNGNVKLFVKVEYFISKLGHSLFAKIAYKAKKHSRPAACVFGCSL